MSLIKSLVIFSSSSTSLIVRGAPPEPDALKKKKTAYVCYFFRNFVILIVLGNYIHILSRDARYIGHHIGTDRYMSVFNVIVNSLIRKCGRYIKAD